MARLQLALNVVDLDQAVAFYGKLFATEPSKIRPGYANFAISDPPLKLVLFESAASERINHLGVEVMSTEEVDAAAGRLESAGEELRADSGACCYAVQEKFWLTDPDGSAWEVYTVLSDTADTGACCSSSDGAASASGCSCGSASTADPVFAGAIQEVDTSR